MKLDEELLLRLGMLFWVRVHVIHAFDVLTLIGDRSSFSAGLRIATVFLGSSYLFNAYDITPLKVIHVLWGINDTFF